MVRILIVYDSKYGNTRRIADRLNEAFISRGIEVFTEKVKNIDYNLIDGFNVIIVGSPTHYWNPSRDIIYFMSELSRRKVRGKIGFIFSTKFANNMLGSAGKKLFMSMRYLGFRLIIPWIDFYVEDVKGPLIDGELEKCSLFVGQIERSISQFRFSEVEANA